MGFPFRKFAHAIETFLPIILEATPLAPASMFIKMGILVAEQATKPGDVKLTGQEKLGLAVEEVRNGIRAVNATSGREVLSPGITDAMIAHGISTAVDIVNLKVSLEAPPVSDSLNLTPQTPRPFEGTSQEGQQDGSPILDNGTQPPEAASKKPSKK